MIFAEKSAAVTKQHWPHVLKSVRDPFDCRASRCTVGSSQIWGWFKTILYRILKGWTCGTSIHQLFCWVHHRIPWWHGYPQPSGCVMLFMFGYAKNHWYPAATFLGGWLGLKTWIQPRNGLIRSNMAHLCPRCTDFKSLLVSMIGFENEQCGMGLIIFHPHPTISITFHNYHYWWANLQHVSILHSQPWDCSTDGGARWVEGSRQVIPVGVGRQKRLWDAVGHSGISPDPENRTCLRIHHPYPLSVPPTTISGASLLQ